VGSKVRFVGPIPHLELIEHYREADIFVFPSVWDEPSGNPPIEAMAVGVPVVSTRTGGTAEYIDDGKCGLLLEPGDANTLAEVILCLLAKENVKKSMGKAGRRRAVELFSFDLMAKNLLSQYERICGNNG